MEVGEGAYKGNAREGRTCGECKHHLGTRCELRPELVVVSPLKPACELFEPKGEVKGGTEAGEGEPLLPSFLKAYHELGFSFFPVEWREKAPPLLEWKEFQSRRPKWEEVEEWLRKFAVFNVAVVCGRVSQLFVIDFDSEEAFYGWLNALDPDTKALVLAKCWVVETGKGFHVYARPESPDLVPRTKIRCREGVDVKGEGGYVIAPPSIHPSGKRYRGYNDPRPSLEPLTREEVERILSTLLAEAKPAEFAASFAAKAAAEALREVPAGPKPAPEARLRELPEERVEKLKEILRVVYEPGNRHLVWLLFSGECALKGVSYLSAARVLKRLYDETGDTDDLRVRGACVVYSYAKRGYRVDKKALAEILGVEPYGPEVLGTEPVKGVAGLRHLFERKLGPAAAEAVVKEVKRLLGPAAKRIPLAWREVNGKKVVRLYLVVRKVGSVWEARVCRPVEGGEGGVAYEVRPFAVLPDIYELHDTATGNVFYIAREGDKQVAASVDLEGLLRQLAARGYTVKPTLLDVNVQRLLRAIIERREGVLTPGLGPEGFVDPLDHGFDSRDYGVEGLLAVGAWVEKYYPEPNRVPALANVAFAVAKLAAPAARVLNPTFIDNPVWNYGRGGEGRSSLVSYAILPLLSVPPNDERCLVAIRGPVETSAQAAFLFASSRMPLILDEQSLTGLAKIAPAILATAVGQGVFKIHAPKYGLGEGGQPGAVFRSLRSPIIFTNVEAERWLKKARGEASDYAFIRRLVVVDWEHEPVDPRAFSDLPNPKPVIGAVERVWLKHGEELAKCRDLVELAKKLFTLLSLEYGADLSAYVKAVEEVEGRWRERLESLKLSDEDMLRERATEIARKELGTTSLTGAKILLSLLENPEAYGTRFAKPKEKKVAEEESKQLFDLATNLATAQGEEKQRLAVKLEELARLQATRLIIRAGSPLVPGTPRQFLGVRQSVYALGEKKVAGYSVPLLKIVRIFLPEAVEEQGEAPAGEGG